MKRIIQLILILTALTSSAMANKTAVSIMAPEKVKAGEEITLVIKVNHRGNSRFHFTKKVVARANKQEIGCWEFSASNRPEAENFTREIKLKIERETEITAEGSCNIHGSAGPAKTIIKIEKQERIQ